MAGHVWREIYSGDETVHWHSSDFTLLGGLRHVLVAVVLIQFGVLVLIYYLTDNEVSHTVAKAFEKGGSEVNHIKTFWLETSSHALPNKTPVFYGILRGSGSAMKTCQTLNHDFIYVDNGYFDAHYMDNTKHKIMDGTYRVVKNDLIDKYTGCPVRSEPRRPLRLLALPPTPYSANMQDTTPEDWFMKLKDLRKITNDHIDIREKTEQRSFAKHVKDYDGVVAFNSMAVMEASKLGKACWDFHGIFRNADKFTAEIPYFDYESLMDFYSTKQFTLGEIAEGQWQ